MRAWVRLYIDMVVLTCDGNIMMLVTCD